jgi:predicted  nucleic acid-binding Zn-ribbon protein
MARIVPLGITLVFLLLTCFFGFETHSKIQAMADTATGLKTQLTSASQRASKAENDRKTAEDKAAKAQADADSIKSQLASVQSNLDTANGKVTTLNQQIADLTKQVQDLTANKPSTTPVQNGPTPEQMNQLTAQLKEAQAEAAELKQVKDTLVNKAKDAESRADDLDKQLEHYKMGTVKNGLEGEVLAVNQGWNFVVLSIGDRQGAVTNAELILKRGDSQIGKVRITSVEPSTSVADIIPGTLSRGVRVQPGDRVIFPGG